MRITRAAEQSDSRGEGGGGDAQMCGRQLASSRRASPPRSSSPRSSPSRARSFRWVGGADSPQLAVALRNATALGLRELHDVALPAPGTLGLLEHRDETDTTAIRAALILTFIHVLHASSWFLTLVASSDVGEGASAFTMPFAVTRPAAGCVAVWIAFRRWIETRV